MTITKDNFKDVFKEDLKYVEDFEIEEIVDNLSDNDLKLINDYMDKFNQAGISNETRFEDGTLRVFVGYDHFMDFYLFNDWDEDPNLDTIQAAVQNLVYAKQFNKDTPIIDLITNHDPYTTTKELTSGLILFIDENDL